jgi:hypothetical protein
MDQAIQTKEVWLVNAELEVNIFPIDHMMTIKIYPDASVEVVLSELQSLCGCMREINEAVQEGHLSATCGKVSLVYLQGLANAMLQSVTKGIWRSDMAFQEQLHNSEGK